MTDPVFDDWGASEGDQVIPAATPEKTSAELAAETFAVQANQSTDPAVANTPGDAEKKAEDDKNAAIEKLKADNPNITDDEINAKLSEAKTTDNVISADLFAIDDSSTAKAPAATTNYNDLFKKVAGEDYDDIAHANLEKEEDLIAAQASLVEKRVNKLVEEQTEANSFYNGLDAVDKEIFNVLKESGIQGLTQYLNPIPQFETYLKMEDSELIIEEMKIQRNPTTKQPLYTEDQISDYVSQLDDMEVIKQANKIRSDINTAKTEAKQKIAFINQQKREATTNEAVARRTKTAEQIKAVLTKKQDFMGMKIDEPVREKIAENYAKGLYDKQLSDPVFLSNAILYNTLGSRITTQLRESIKADAKKELNINEHNAHLGSPAGGNQFSKVNGGHFGDW